MRFYNYNGTLLPSITTILQLSETEEEYEHYSKARAFVSDATMAEAMEAARMRGNHCHKALENYLLHKTPIEVDSSYGVFTSQKGLDLIQQQLDTFEPLLVETPLYSKELRFAGTADAVVKHNDEHYVIDFKTSKTNYKAEDAFFKSFQLAASALLYEFIYGVKVDKGMILNWNVKTKHKGLLVYEVSNLLNAKVAFLQRVQFCYDNGLNDLLKNLN